MPCYNMIGWFVWSADLIMWPTCAFCIGPDPLEKREVNLHLPQQCCNNIAKTKKLWWEKIWNRIILLKNKNSQMKICVKTNIYYVILMCEINKMTSFKKKCHKELTSMQKNCEEFVWTWEYYSIEIGKKIITSFF